MEQIPLWNVAVSSLRWFYLLVRLSNCWFWSFQKKSQQENERTSPDMSVEVEVYIHSGDMTGVTADSY